MTAEVIQFLDQHQRQIVEDIIAGKVRYLQGGAGTGKSTIIKAVVDRLGDRVAVFTKQNKTKEMLIERGIHTNAFDSLRKEDFIINLMKRGVTHLIVDEASMISRREMNDFVGFICDNGRIFKFTFFGDPDQLSPISKLPAVFDITWFTHDIADAVLRRPYRQNQETVINRYRSISELDDLATYDAIVCMSNKTRHEMNVKCHLARYGEEGLKDANKMRLLVPQAGQKLIFRKHGNDEAFKAFTNQRAYEVISVKSTRDYFKITFKMPSKKKIVTREVTLPKAQFNVHDLTIKRDFEPSFAITGHAAQGDQWGKVAVIVETNEHFDEDQKLVVSPVIKASDLHQWFTVATTRGTGVVHVIDQDSIIQRYRLRNPIAPEISLEPQRTLVPARFYKTV